MKLIIQGRKLFFEGDDGTLVRLPEDTQANIDVVDPHGIRVARNVVNLSFRLTDQQIVHRPADALDEQRFVVTLGEGRGTHHRQHLLVYARPPFDLNDAKQPRLEGWTGTGGIAIEGPLAATIPFVWVYNRTVEGPPPLVEKLSREQRTTLLRGAWRPTNQVELNRNLVACFQPCFIASEAGRYGPFNRVADLQNAAPGHYTRCSADGCGDEDLADLDQRTGLCRGCLRERADGAA